jgi:hypothetical protein
MVLVRPGGVKIPAPDHCATDVAEQSSSCPAHIAHSLLQNYMLAVLYLDASSK